MGHTGDFDAAIKAVETLDVCIHRCVVAMQAVGGEVLIARHGNVEQMFDALHHQRHTQHTTNKVPLLYIGRTATLGRARALTVAPPCCR